MTTGLDLKLERVAAGVTATDLAARMGVSRGTVWHIETSRNVDESKAADYRRALATFRNVATEGPSAA